MTLTLLDKTILLIMFGSFLVLGGCSQWTHPINSPSQTSVDIKKCRAIAAKKFPAYYEQVEKEVEETTKKVPGKYECKSVPIKGTELTTVKCGVSASKEIVVPATTEMVTVDINEYKRYGSYAHCMRTKGYVTKRSMKKAPYKNYRDPEIPLVPKQWSDSLPNNGYVFLTNPKMVKEVQEKLLQKGYEPGIADGIWGPQSHRAMKAFQKEEDIMPTGRLDWKTQKALGLE